MIKGLKIKYTILKLEIQKNITSNFKALKYYMKGINMGKTLKNTQNRTKYIYFSSIKL